MNVADGIGRRVRDRSARPRHVHHQQADDNGSSGSPHRSGDCFYYYEEILILLSGPKRFNYDEASRTWRHTRDGVELLQLLRGELKQLLTLDIDFDKKEED